MDLWEMPKFQEFSNKHFGMKEEVVYRLQIEQIKRDKPKAGQFEKPLETQDGNSIIVYYYYDGNDTLYVLSGHLSRKGEPSPAESKTIERYIEEIRKESTG